MNLSKQLHELSKKLTVLYVEDDIPLQHKTSLLLSSLFQNCISAQDGVEALVLYEKYFQDNNKYIDIVISDIQMPHKNGIELSREILEKNQKQLIVIISAHDDSKYLIELLNLNISNFILKPMQSEQFLQTLYSCCQKVNAQHSNAIVDLGCNYSWNKEKQILHCENIPVKLSIHETAIVNILLLIPGQIFSNDMLIDIVYGDNLDEKGNIDSIKSIFKRLRKKLPLNLIENIYAQGYRINLS
ncbi:MAG: response regulator transcription factor [Campylobacterota bacterium]|nr:response regulator transcription factor [Campylobacterota bacterium]